jgi:hypothetical protein
MTGGPAAAGMAHTLGTAAGGVHSAWQLYTCCKEAASSSCSSCCVLPDTSQAACICPQRDLEVVSADWAAMLAITLHPLGVVALQDSGYEEGDKLDRQDFEVRCSQHLLHACMACCACMCSLEGGPVWPGHMFLLCKHGTGQHVDMQGDGGGL